MLGVCYKIAIARQGFVSAEKVDAEMVPAIRCVVMVGQYLSLASSPSNHLWVHRPVRVWVDSGVTLLVGTLATRICWQAWLSAES